MGLAAKGEGGGGNNGPCVLRIKSGGQQVEEAEDGVGGA